MELELMSEGLGCAWSLLSIIGIPFPWQPMPAIRQLPSNVTNLRDFIEAPFWLRVRFCWARFPQLLLREIDISRLLGVDTPSGVAKLTVCAVTGFLAL